MNKHVFIRATQHLLIALALAACAQEELPGGAGDKQTDTLYPLVISSVQMEEMTGVVTRVSENTDGSASQWEGGEIVRVRIGNEKSGTYQVGDDGSLTALSPTFWPDKREPQTIRAWYPAEEKTAIPLDRQASDDKPAYVLKAEQDAHFGQPVSLLFTHQLAKVRVKLQKGDFEGDLSDATLTMQGLPTSCVISDGTLTAGNTIGDIPMRKASYGAETYYEANVLPGSPDTPLTFKIGANGKETTTGLEKPFTLEAAHVHTFTVTMNKKIPTPDEIGEINGDGTYIVSGKGTKSITITGGSPTVILKDVSIDGVPGVIIKGGANATLRFQGTNNAIAGRTEDKDGIQICENSNVIVQGEGAEKTALSIQVTAHYSSGIGPGYNNTAGNITVRDISLEIKTHEGNGIGAGIGAICGDIFIENAILDISSEKKNFSAIGASKGSTSATAVCGDITIKNSEITATTGYNGPYAQEASLIGTSGSEEPNTQCGNIDIYLKEGQTREAFEGKLKNDGYAAIIGNGYSYYNKQPNKAQVGTITWRSADGGIIEQTPPSP